MLDTTTFSLENGLLSIAPHGKIDTMTSGQIEEEINKIREENSYESILLDFDDVKYVSSSGLRIVLRLRKAESTLKVINASPEVYDVFEMTGFSEMMPIEKALRKLSVDGCDIIGRGAKGTVYRIDADTIIKVYEKGVSRESIDRERSLAKKAFVCGIPTAISFDVVKVGDKLGTVFELLNAKSLSELMASEVELFDKYARTYAELLKTIHAIEADDEIPSIKPFIYDWLEEAKAVLTEGEYAKIKSMLDAVPESNTMLHCDYHTNNILVQNGEVLLIDMDTLSKGNPVFELANIFATYVGFGEVKHSVVEKFIGLPYDKTVKIWDEFLPIYMSGSNEPEIEHARLASELLGYLRVLRHNIRRGALDTPEGREIIETALKNLRTILPKVDSLEI